MNSYIYEVFFPNNSIGFACSVNGGNTFIGQQLLPGSLTGDGGIVVSWGPAIALFQNGTG